MSQPPPEDSGGNGGRSRANVAAVIGIVVLALLAYWAFTAIDKQRRLQKCLDEGRRNCLEIVSPDK